MSAALGIGLVVDGLEVPAWQAELVQALSSEPGFRRPLFLVKRGGHARRRAPALAGAYDLLDRLLDRGRNRRLRAVVLAPADAEILPWTPPRGPDGLRLEEELGARLRERRLDLLLDLGDHGLGREWAAVARCGLWTIRFGEDPRCGGELPRLWETVDRPSHVTAAIEALGADGTRRAVGRTTCGAHPYSLLRTRCVLAAATVNLTLGRLRSLRELGPGFLSGPSRASERPEVARPGSPGPIRLALLAATCGARVLRRLWQKALLDDFYWSVAVAPRPASAGLEAAIREASFRELAQPADRFHADPFVFEHRGQQILFMEAFPHATGRGVIAASRLDSDGSASPPEPVLERPYHLSYPHVFSWRGEIFMVPETSANRTIELYRCERFPDRWVLDTVLMEGVEAADATVLEFAGRLWMFVTLATRGMWLDTELHLFHAGDLRGPWQAHPLNPVVSDVRRARSAGPIWKEEGRLIRPAQDCSPGHASAISFQRITALSTEDYAEEPFARLTASQLRWKPGAERTHHWCMGARFLAVDATVSRLRGPGWLRPGGGAGGAPGHSSPTA